jgi:hypothetical protein
MQRTRRPIDLRAFALVAALVTIALAVLRGSGAIDWPWWLVLAPWWGTCVVILALLLAAIVKAAVTKR